MLDSLKKNFRPEKGQVVVFTVLLLPLILGVVVFVIEIGNIYVHYSDFVTVADAAADAVKSTKDGTKAKKITNAKKVAVANSRNFSDKSDFAIATYTLNESESPDANLYIKLEKNMPLIFINVFINATSFKAYIISSEEETNVFYKADSLENLNWVMP